MNYVLKVESFEGREVFVRVGSEDQDHIYCVVAVDDNGAKTSTPDIAASRKCEPLGHKPSNARRLIASESAKVTESAKVASTWMSPF